MSSREGWEQTGRDIQELLDFLRESKRMFKEVGISQEKFAEKCLKAGERQKKIGREQIEKLTCCLEVHVKTVAGSAQAQACLYLSIHQELKSLVSIVKHTQHALDQRIKQSNEQIRAAKKAWDKAESHRLIDSTSVSAQIQAKTNADIAQKWKENYDFVVEGMSKQQFDLRHEVETMYEQSAARVAEALMRCGADLSFFEPNRRGNQGKIRVNQLALANGPAVSGSPLSRISAVSSVNSKTSLYLQAGKAKRLCAATKDRMGLWKDTVNMTSVEATETALQEVQELLEFLRETKRLFKAVGLEQGKFAERCLKSVKREKVMSKPETETLLWYVELFVKSVAAKAQAQGNFLLSVHQDLKLLVATSKDTKRTLEQGTKQCIERLRTAKRALDKAESSRFSDSTSVAAQIQAKTNADIAQRLKTNYDSVVTDVGSVQQEYQTRVEELKEEGVAKVCQALKHCGVRTADSPHRSSHSRKPKSHVLALPLQPPTPLSSHGRFDTTHTSPHLGCSQNISGINSEQYSSEASFTIGSANRVSSFLLQTHKEIPD